MFSYFKKWTCFLLTSLIKTVLISKNLQIVKSPSDRARNRAFDAVIQTFTFRKNSFEDKLKLSQFSDLNSIAVFVYLKGPY